MSYPKLRRFFLTVVSVCALICMLSVTAVAAETEDGYGYNHLESVVQQEIYIGIRDGVAELKNPISFTVSNPEITGDDLQIAADMVAADYPEYFWFDCGLSAELYSSGLVKLTTTYEIGGKTVTSADKQYDALMDEVEQILEGMPADADTDYEKALYLHDALAQRVTYVFTDNDQTAYGALVEGEAVCAGYARAYQLLLEKANVAAWTVIGDSVDPNSGSMVPHAWNLVWLDGDCYYTDVTWDDQGEALFHGFFSRSLAEFADTHAPTAAYQAMLPTCGHDEYDYFTLEAYDGSGVGGIVNDSTSASEVFDYVKVRQADGYTYAVINLWYNGTNFGNWLNNYVSYVASELDLNGYFCTYNWMTNEYQVVIISGIGSVHTKAGDACINLALSYQGAGLTEGKTYDLMVAYYTDEGQFIEMDTLQVTMGRYGMASVSAACPEEFGVCKVFVPAEDTFVPLAKAIVSLQK